MAELSITVGAGRANPRGRVVALASDVPPARALAAALEAQPAGGEQWWSVHNWSEGYRKIAGWHSSAGVGIDIDFENGKGPDPKAWDHVAPPLEVAAELQAAALDGKIPGSLFHLTPRGARVVFVFRAMVTDRELMTRAAQGAGKQVADALVAAGVPIVGPGRPGYTVDQKVLTDLARLLFAPRCVVEGVKRNAAVHVLREDGYDAKDLALPARTFTLVTAATMEVGEAVAKYNRDNARAFPRNGGDCPVCGHKGCFGTVPASDPPRWSCFSDSHAGAGKKGDACWTGDVLDLDAWEAKCSPVELLKRRGFLRSTAPTSARSLVPETDAGGGHNVVPIRDEGYRILRSNSYGSAVFILRTPELRERVLGRGVLEFNEMTLSVTLNRRPLTETDYLRVRELCETALGESEEKGYKFSRQDIEDAIRQVAHEREFHPVRDYLRSLVWDQVPRIDRIAEEVLGVAPDALNNTLIRKWLISAVARAEKPGCDAHGVLILKGPGGAGKSTFFKVLASRPWFGDTAMNLEDKNDAYMKLHTTWIYEWGELESMQRARSTNTVKGFVTSSEDRFRAPYDREMRLHPRCFVLCGTTNEHGILTEGRGGGDRRYWIIDTPYAFEIPKLVEWRDQVWAEAFALYSAAESSQAWHLTKDEEAELGERQTKFLKRDAWEDRIRAWISQHKVTETKVSAVLVALDKPIGQWTDRDEARAERILRALEWSRRDDGTWISPESLPF